MTLTTRRWAELFILFIALPIIMAFAIHPSRMWTVLLSSGALAIVLLHFTDTFRWNSLLQGRVHWRQTLALGAITLAIASELCWWLLPRSPFPFDPRAPFAFTNSGNRLPP